MYTPDPFEIILDEITMEYFLLRDSGVDYVPIFDVICEICEKYQIEDIDFAKMVKLKKYNRYFKLFFNEGDFENDYDLYS